MRSRVVVKEIVVVIAQVVWFVCNKKFMEHPWYMYMYVGLGHEFKDDVCIRTHVYVREIGHIIIYMYM